MTEALDKIRKAFALAFGARDEEQRAAWLGVMRLCLQQGWKSLDEMLAAFGRPVTTDNFYRVKSDTPFGWDTVLTFGKHEGRTLGEVARTDRGYVEWLNDGNVRSVTLRRAVESVAEWLEENPEEP